MKEPTAEECSSNAIVETDMSLRDYFAAKAMAAFIMTPRPLQIPGKETQGESDIAKAAYIQADAMLAARNPGKEGWR